MERLGEPKLTNEQTFIIRRFSHGGIGRTIEWLNGELKMPPFRFAEWQQKIMPYFLREAYVRESSKPTVI